VTTYEILARHGTGAALKVAVLAFLVLVLRLAVFPLALATLLLDRAIGALSTAVANVPAAPVRLVHVAGDTR
jgi:hypothetical protein